MINTIKCTLIELVRIPGIMVWSLVFPLILMGVFSLMFGPLDDMADDMDPTRIVVVESGGDAEAAESAAFDSFIEAVSSGNDRLLDVQWAADAREAEQAVTASQKSDEAIIGYVQLADGKPVFHVSDALSAQGLYYERAFIVRAVMDEYVERAALLQGMMERDTAVLANQAAMASLFDAVDATRVVDVTRDQPKESVRYYFALLGMAALFGGSVSLTAFQRLRPNLSALGARRAVGGLSHGRAVAATLIGCWILDFACLAVAYLALRFVIGISFEGRDAACLTVVGASSLTAMALGCAISCIPKVPESSKSGMLTGVVCFASLFAGLYGQPTMQLADSIAQSAPWVTWINPASQISQAFYSVMYYDSLAPMAVHVGVLVLMALVLFALSVGSLRRQRYASL